MNTIPTTFNESLTAYTAVGGRESMASTGLTAVILNRQGRFPRRTFFQELEKTGFDNVISIESSSEHYDVEELSARFPYIRFVIPEREINLGEQINLGALETETPLFFVIRNDLKVVAGGTAGRMAERLVNENGGGFKRLCTIPLIMNSRYEVLPTIIVPATRKRKIQKINMVSHVDGVCSLYPFDGVGIYDRQRFIQMNGYDVSINNTYWQLMDFGFRSYLWGEKTALNTSLKLSCDGDIPVQDMSADRDFNRFFLKNLVPVFKDDHAYLPYYYFPGYLFRSGEDIITAWNEFNRCKDWVKTNQFRWRYDIKNITKQWNEADLAPEGNAN
jgi:hypothetical protein